MLARGVGGIVAAALVLGLLIFGLSGPVAAEPTQVKAIKGKELVLYKDATGAPFKRIPAASIETPLEITDSSAPNRYQVIIGPDMWWILKAQTVTNQTMAGPAVSCQSLAKSFAPSRGFSDCKK